MIPVLIKLEFQTLATQLILYAIALALIAYAAFAGYRGADKGDEVRRALIFGVIGAVLSGFGLWYALPKSAPLFGSKGEGIPIHTYGLMLATGFVSAVTLASRLAQREWRGEESLKRRDQIFDVSFYILIAAIVGSKVMYIIANFREFLQAPQNYIVGGGLVFYGGLLGAMAASIWYCRKNNMDFFRLADLAIPTVSLGQAFGRLGCFSAGCCWGDVAPHGTRLAVQFPDGQTATTLFGNVIGTPSLAWQSMSTDDRFVNPATGIVNKFGGEGFVKMSEWVAAQHHTFPIWPTQLMESVGQVSLLVFFLWMRRYRRFHGQILGMWLMGYALLRTTVEVFRGDTERGTMKHAVETLGMQSLANSIPLEAAWNISLGQFISLCMFLVGVTILYRRGKGKLFSPPAVAVPA